MLKYFLLLLLPPRLPGVRSLRRQLLALSLLAVLAGSAVLVVTHSVLSANARRLRHLQAVERVRLELLAAQINARPGEGLQDHLQRLLMPGMLVWMVGQPPRSQTMPRLAAGFAMSIPLNVLLQRAESLMRTAGPHEFRVGQLSYVSSGLTVSALEPRGLVRLGFLILALEILQRVGQIQAAGAVQRIAREGTAQPAFSRTAALELVDQAPMAQQANTRRSGWWATQRS